MAPFSRKEIEALLDVCQYTRRTHTEDRRSFRMRRPKAKRDTALILFLLDTGVRIGELCRLKYGHVNLKEKSSEGQRPTAWGSRFCSPRAVCWSQGGARSKVMALDCSSAWRSLPQIRHNIAELFEGGFEVFDHVGGDEVGIGQIGGFFEGFVANPEDVEVDFVAGQEFIVGE